MNIKNICYLIPLFFFCMNIMAGEKVFVSKVVDGDTLVLSDGRKIRLIGVDTPEVHESEKLIRDAQRTKKDISTIKELGMRSSAFTKSLVDQKEVEIEYDLINYKNGNKDKYGRTLAYVYFDCDKAPGEYKKYLDFYKKEWKPGKLMLNRLLLQCGYASVYTRFPYKYFDEFRKYDKEAREAKTGLWHTNKDYDKDYTKQDIVGGISLENVYVASKSGKTYHKRDCPHAKKIKEGNVIYFYSLKEAETSKFSKCSKCIE